MRYHEALRLADKTVPGGWQNHALGMGSAIPGGIGLEALDFQTAVGRYNSNPSYTGQLRNYYHLPADTIVSIGDEITFMVGNGASADSAHRSNAFEVSDNGHSIVHDMNGSTSGADDPTGRKPYYGGTYQDNTIIWGDVSKGAPSPFKIPINADIGVDSVHNPVAGQYIVFLSLQDSKNNPVVLNNGSVTVTVEDDGTGICDFATATQIRGNVFTVFIHKMGTDCRGDEQPFMFKVCGRP